jgi:S-formylglutathione hydrolase FrmB
MRRLWLCVLCAACGDDHTTTLKCASGTTGMLTVDSPITVGGGGADLRGASIAATPHTTIPSGELSIDCADDIVPAGYIALGPAVTFGAEGTWSDRPFELTLPYKAARLPKGAARRHVRIVAKRASSNRTYFPAIANRVIDDHDPYASRATFSSGLLTTYQAVALETAGQGETQQFGWNAIAGISMGGNAAMAIGLRHADRFDATIDLGGELGPSLVYSLGMVRDFLFGGFCTAADQAAGRGNVGQLCPNHTNKPDQFEIESDYEHMVTQTGDGVGLTLNRSLYMQASRDLARALGNPAMYNPTNPYAPPGVDMAFLSQPAATRCATPAVLTNFYDKDFNPDGSKPVITFCDGNDGPALGNAVFDPSIPETDPAELLLAVDLNGNGKRDSGEPVITKGYEPFLDVGGDGLADVDEPGYDPITNPDPNGDDYHYLRNPLGTEGNGTYDPGEPFMDVGLDGVAGTCQAPQAGCYDFGEGNGKWDISPNVARWYEQDLMVRFAALTDAQRNHMALWFDGGIRDFLNASVSSNQSVAAVMANYDAPFGVYDNFAVLTGDTSEASYDFTAIPWADWPKDGYLRYGNPDASPSEIAGGDGKHVGTTNQIIYRVQTAFAWINQRWPDGDYDDTLDGGSIFKDLSFTSPTTGRLNPFSLFLPPGYDAPENAGKRYPVVYFLHGYGQQPSDLVDLSAIFANYMISTVPLESRFQKFIIVYVDGRCRPHNTGVPVDPTGDACEEGTFYMDAPLGGTARMEQNLLDLMDYIDANYRTKQASMADVTP